MGKLWRPDNWENPYREGEFRKSPFILSSAGEGEKEGRAYEAGATAMFDACWDMLVEACPEKVFGLVEEYV